MFNHDNKELFISESGYSESRKKMARVVFEATEKYEERAGIDLACMDFYFAKGFIDEIVSYRQVGKYVKLSIIRAYVNWCASKGMIGVNTQLATIDVDAMSSIRVQMVADPETLQRRLDMTFSPEENEFSDLTLRACLWLSFAGVEQGELASIKTSDVNIARRTVTVGDRELEIEKLGMKSIELCKDLSYFRYSHPLYKDPSIIKMRGDSNILLRGFRPTRTIENLRSMISVEAKKSGLRFSIDRISLSGTFYRLWLAEVNGFRPNFRAFVEATCPNLGSVQSVLSRAYGYESDYRLWKLAFNK